MPPEPALCSLQRYRASPRISQQTDGTPHVTAAKGSTTKLLVLVERALPWGERGSAGFTDGGREERADVQSPRLQNAKGFRAVQLEKCLGSLQGVCSIPRCCEVPAMAKRRGMLVLSAQAPTVTVTNDN